jgi:hypothetical protein
MKLHVKKIKINLNMVYKFHVSTLNIIRNAISLEFYLDFIARDRKRAQRKLSMMSSLFNSKSFYWKKIACKNHCCSNKVISFTYIFSFLNILRRKTTREKPSERSTRSISTTTCESHPGRYSKKHNWIISEPSC